MEQTLMMKLRPASERYGVSYDRLRKMCIAGEVANFKTGRSWLINTKSLEQLLNSSGLKEHMKEGHKNDPK